jgi:hypothetical protein
MAPSALPSLGQRPGDEPSPGADEPTTSGGRSALVIVAALSVAAFGMVGSFIERAASGPSGEPRVAAGRSASPQHEASPVAMGDTGSHGPPGCEPQGAGAVVIEAPERDGPTAAVAADFRFRGSLDGSDVSASSAGGRVPTLVPTGGGMGFETETVRGRPPGTVLTISAAGGLVLPHAATIVGSEGYAIELLFRLDTITGYRKLIDFDGGASDRGLYVRDGCLEFFDVAASARPSVAADRYAHVVMTRDGRARVIGYVDGLARLSFVDQGGLASIGGQGLRFFGDDRVTGGIEAPSGSIARVRLYDGPIGPLDARLACGQLLGTSCGPSTAEYVDQVATICREATAEADRVPANLAASSGAAVRASARSIRRARALPPPVGTTAAAIDQLYDLLEPTVGALRELREAEVVGDEERVRSLERARIDATHIKDQLVMSAGRSWLGLVLQSCPIELPA